MTRATTTWRAGTSWTVGEHALEVSLRALDERASGAGLIVDKRWAGTPAGRRVLARIRQAVPAEPVDQVVVDGPVGVDDVRRMAARWRRAGATSILAFGGGTVMDAACLSALPQDQLAAPGFEVGRSGLVALPASRRPPLPRLVVPTTLGTGAEVSATACCDGGSGKLLVLGDALRPELAAIDPAATRELPVGMAREAVVEVLARLLVPYAANPAGEAGVGRVADAHVLADLGTLGSLAASASASGFDDDTRLTLATVSAHSHAGWGTLGRPLFASPLWFVATELSAALQTTKATATALLLPAWATAVLVGDRRWGDAARLRTAWSALDAEAGPDLAVGLERFCRSFTDALGEVRRSIGVTGLRALAESVGVRCVRRWGAGLPMLGSLDVLAVEDLVRRAVRPPQELLTAGAGVVPRG